MSPYLTVSLMQNTKQATAKINPISPQIDAFEFSFFSRGFPLWNGLPCNIVLTQSYEQFQDLLHKLYNIN